MSISNYTSYFHDGSLIGVEQEQSVIVLSMESAEISSEENVDHIVLSEQLTIKGKLHLEGVGLIMENENQISSFPGMLCDSASILHFDIQNEVVKLDLEWVNFPPNPKTTVYSFYVINAKKIWWENIPNLFDPFG